MEKGASEEYWHDGQESAIMSGMVHFPPVSPTERIHGFF